MGLDMYLSARLYVSEYSGDDLKPAYEKLAKLKLPGLTIPRQYIQNFGSFELEVPVMYWRKANHIHQWFVDNCQDGEDDCRTADVEIEKLRELAKLCSEVAASNTPAFAAEHLPCSQGFFFGGTEYDKWYFDETRDTMQALDQLLADIDSGKLKAGYSGWSFQYRSSW